MIKLRQILVGMLLMVVLIAGAVGAAEIEGVEITQAEISALIGELRSSNYGVSLRAQQELIAVGEPSVPLLRILIGQSQDRWEKAKVIYVLGGIGSESAIRALLHVINDSDATVRTAIVNAVRNLDEDQVQTAAPLFITHLISTHAVARENAAAALQAMGLSEAELAEVLVDAVIESSGSERQLALAELGKLGEAAAFVVPTLLELMNTDPTADSLSILEAIAQIGDPAVIPVMLDFVEPMLVSPNWDVRQDAIWIMRRLRLDDKAMLQPALDLLDSNEEVDQRLAIDLLAHLGITNGEAVYKLIEIVSDSEQSPFLRSQSYQALESLYSQMEYEINRGLVAIATDDGIYLGWRLLGTDPFELGFDIYRNDVKINQEPILDSTNYLDVEGSLEDSYHVVALFEDGEELTDPVTPWEQNYLAVPLQRPSGGVNPRGERYEYTANDASIADLDGDGEYEIVLKWDPTNSKDNAHSGYTGNVYIDAYKLDGTLMWRIDLGRNIRAGAHYTQFMVYDLDGDGRAEVAMKTADGTIDGQGKVIGNPSADYRNSSGYVLAGPEFLTVFDGETGAALATVDYHPPRGSVSSWGDSYGNRVDRFLAGIAYLDGNRPSLIMSRGYYTRTVIVAYNYRDGELTQEWIFDTNMPGLSSYRGQGNHQLSIADVDFDGRDEIIFGAMTIDDDGTPLYNTGLGHGDALHVGDFDPMRPGLEVYGVHENRPNPAGINLRDARTGEIIWGEPTDRDVGRGLIADIDPNYPGAESWASGGVVKSAAGESLTISRPSINFAIWWDGDLLRELLDNTTISKWDWERRQLVTLLYAAGTQSNNGTKATPALTADIFGDWREEVVLRSSNSQELRIYSTTDLTEHRIHTLMHDRMYRVAVAWQNVAYNQPPHPSFYIGPDLPPPTYNPGVIHNVLIEYRGEF